MNTEVHIGDTVYIRYFSSNDIVQGTVVEHRERPNGVNEYRVEWSDGQMNYDWFMACEFDQIKKNLKKVSE